MYVNFLRQLAITPCVRYEELRSKDKVAALEYHIAHLPLQLELNSLNLNIGGKLHLDTSSPASQQDLVVTIRVEDSKYLDISGHVWSMHLSMGADKVPLMYRRKGPRFYPVRSENCDDECLLRFHVSDQMHRISGNSETLRPWVQSEYAVGNSDTKRLMAMRQRQTELENVRNKAQEELLQFERDKDDAVEDGDQLRVDKLHVKVQEQLQIIDELNHKIEIGNVAMEQVSLLSF